MNQYQRELAAMDRRAWRIRAAVVACVAVVMAAALWSAGVPDRSWFAWLADPEPQPAAVESTPAAMPSLSPPVAAAGSTQTSAPQRLRLLSTAPGRNAREGTAQLGTDPIHPQTYAAGALLENGAVLVEIHADHVTLQRDGQRTQLYLEGSAAPPQQQPLASGDGLAMVDAAPSKMTAAASPPTYTEIIRAAPRFENRQLIGFETYPGTQSATFFQAGLQAGDLITALDGTPVKDTDALQKALKTVAEGGSVVATVYRGDEQLSLTLEAAAVPVPPALLK